MELQYIAAYILVFVLAVAFMRWAFGLGQMIQFQKAIIMLLIHKLKKEGSTTEEIDEIITKAYGGKK